MHRPYVCMGIYVYMHMYAYIRAFTKSYYSMSAVYNNGIMLSSRTISLCIPLFYSTAHLDVIMIDLVYVGSCSQQPITEIKFRDERVSETANHIFHWSRSCKMMHEIKQEIGVSYNWFAHYKAGMCPSIFWLFHFWFISTKICLVFSINNLHNSVITLMLVKLLNN